MQAGLFSSVVKEHRRSARFWLPAYALFASTMRRLKLLGFAAAMPLFALANPFPKLPAAGDLPDHFGGKADPVRTTVLTTVAGLHGVTWKAFTERAPDGSSIANKRRIPVWYVVEVAGDETKEVTVDLYDIGLQGRKHAVYFRVVAPADAKHELIDDQGTVTPGAPVAGGTMVALAPSNYQAASTTGGKSKWDVIGRVRFKAKQLVIECYRIGDDAPPPPSRQPDDGSPPPGSSGEEH